MLPLLVASALCLVGLATVWWALLRDDVEAGVEDATAPVALPADWDVLPTRSDLARMEFGLRVPGYDPASVDTAFDALAEVYADLLECADDATRERARRRIARRVGREEDLEPSRRPGPRLNPSTPPSSTTEEALVAEVALDAIDHGRR